MQLGKVHHIKTKAMCYDWEMVVNYDWDCILQTLWLRLHTVIKAASSQDTTQLRMTATRTIVTPTASWQHWHPTPYCWLPVPQCIAPATLPTKPPTSRSQAPCCENLAKQEQVNQSAASKTSTAKVWIASFADSAKWKQQTVRVTLKVDEIHYHSLPVLAVLDSLL